MKSSVWIGLLSAALGAPLSAKAQQESPPSYVPTGGFVPDSATAVRIAVAIWTPIYGARQIRREAPYRATLRDGVWTVVGSLDCKGQACVGGVALAEIAKRDARILRVSHGR